MSVPPARLAIGALSARAGCPIETIRYYERIGLIPPPPRTSGGHRVYAPDHVKRLSFVRRCRELGFGIDAIRALLGLVDGGGYACAEIKDATLRHLRDVQRKIADLQRMAASLEDIAAQCEGGNLPDCPIVDALYAEMPPRAETGHAGP